MALTSLVYHWYWEARWAAGMRSQLCYRVNSRIPPCKPLVCSGSLCFLLSAPLNLKLKPNLTDTGRHLSLTLSKKLPCKGTWKANSHPSFNFADISPMFSKCPKHCADACCGETDVSGLLYIFLLYLPNCIISSLSLGTPPHSIGGVRRSRDIFVCLLSLCTGAGGHRLPPSITHPAGNAAGSLGSTVWGGKTFQFKHSGTKLRIAPCSYNDEPCSAYQISQHYAENKVYLAVCFLGQDQFQKDFLNKTVCSRTNVVLSPFSSVHQNTNGNGATSRCKAKPTSPPLDFLDYSSFL